MAISLSQNTAGATLASFTFSISGVTENRKTEIYIPYASAWYTLSDAKTIGYIYDYSSTDPQNGSITVQLYEDDVFDYKVWNVRVWDLDQYGIEIDVSEIFPAILRFYWDGASSKSAGNEIDITENDFQNLNKFSYQIQYYCAGIDEPYTISTDAIYAADLVEFADKIYLTAAGFGVAQLGYKDFILERCEQILFEAYSGGDFRAIFFYDIQMAINYFKLSL